MRGWGAAAWMVGFSLCHGLAQSTKPIGTLATADASVTNGPGGSVTVSGARAVLTGSAAVTAKDHTAAVQLERGGELRVCLGTGVHLAQAPDESLLLGLDRGAMELQTTGLAGDVVMTPDLRFTLSAAGPLNLQVRVTPAGDTCVDNRGRKAPTLKISDAFGEASYELKPEQHVTFEHGSLREVVDQETVPCGCPPDEVRSGSLADALISGTGTGRRVTPEQSAAAHPFPAAVSDGLAPPSPLPAEAAGQTHVQVATTLTYDPNASAAPAPAPAAAPSAPAPAQARVTGGRGGAFAAIGRFFKRLFAR